MQDNPQVPGTVAADLRLVAECQHLSCSVDEVPSEIQLPTQEYIVPDIAAIHEGLNQCRRCI
jgi:hypothetical protein